MTAAAFSWALGVQHFSAMSLDREFSPGGRRRSSDARSVRGVFGQVMGLVAVTVGCAALGAYLGRNLNGGGVLPTFIGAFACVFGLQFAVAARARAARDRAAVRPRAAARAGRRAGDRLLRQGGSGRALAGGGRHRRVRRRAGRLRLRDAPRPVAFAGSFWALIALIVFGLVLVFVAIPNGNLIYSVLGLVIFGGFTTALTSSVCATRAWSRRSRSPLDLPRHLQHLPVLPADLRRRRRAASAVRSAAAHRRARSAARPTGPPRPASPAWCGGRETARRSASSPAPARRRRRARRTTARAGSGSPASGGRSANAALACSRVSAPATTATRRSSSSSVERPRGGMARQPRVQLLAIGVGQPHARRSAARLAA